MVLWQSDLRISWRAQWFSLLLHGVVAALVLLVPWPLSYTPLWLILLSLVYPSLHCHHHSLLYKLQL